ncbi:hypothetical protein DXG03_003991 [Asterophora parasitica]|uniref:Checkpoint protein n=1 Tax=Asterophora parasitica TaxID=117018 RepID=A0A9P7G108_9AGAR|nr:hypothetical protein DXG03_003991 [Asterophora parasitica]
MAISSEALLAALKSASSSSTSSYEIEEVIMKLAKKNAQAVLSFEINSLTRVGRKVRVSHDVKIEVMRPADVARLAEPMCPEPDLHILLPPLQKLRTVVDRLKPMSDILAVRANSNGCLRLSINTESVKVDTEWKDCTHPITKNAPPDPEDAPDLNQLFTVLVSLRSFLKFLNSHVVSTTTIACAYRRL